MMPGELAPTRRDLDCDLSTEWILEGENRVAREFYLGHYDGTHSKHIMQGDVLGNSHDQRYFGFDSFLDGGCSLVSSDIDGGCVGL